MTRGAGRIATLLAVRNGAAFLGAALDSIARQTRPPDEIWLIDDGSTDDTPAIARRTPHVRYLWQEPRGQAAALNLGLQRTEAEHVSFLDADDLWSADKLERQLAVLSQEPHIDAVFGSALQVCEPEVQGRVRALPSGPEPSHLLQTVLVRRAFLGRVGPLREDLAVAAGLDWYARWRHAGLREVMLPEIVLHRRIHQGNVGKSLAAPAGYFAALRAKIALERAAAPGAS